MGQNFLSQVANQGKAERMALILALAIGGILLTAAIGKFFFPTEYLKAFDQWVSAFEVLLLLGILFLRKQTKMWLSAALVFASWGGYAFFWCLVELPCSCMGEMLKVPTGLTIALDLVFFSSCLVVASLLGAMRQVLFLTVLGGLLISLGGFAFGDWIYKNRVLKNEALMSQFADD
jgi:hypothetical protein